jgi:glycosyltransferase involved in cell wall biosynthesis
VSESSAPTPQAALGGESDRGTDGARPLVSVVIPTRDRPELLAEAIDSVMGQDYSGPIEVVVVVDGGPQPRLPSSQHHRDVRWIPNARRTGLAGSRNTGIEAARGSLVAFCDDDDRWYPRKLSRQVEAWAAQPGSVMLSCGIRITEAAAGTTTDRSTGSSRITFADLLRDRHAELHSSTLLMPREALLGPLGLVNEEVPGSFGEDYDLLLRAARLAPIVALQEVLVEVRWHGGSFFFERWEMMRRALTWLLEQYPEFADEPRGYSRIAGQIAFAAAASGDRREAMRWVGRSLRRNPLERRAPLAGAVALGLVSGETVMARLNARGRGI